jgi:hypothetical protein
MVVMVPVPVIDPGFRVQEPVAGSPFNTTLPVARVHVGWVIVPTAGSVGVSGCGLMTMLPDAGEVHPDGLVTV